MPAFLACLATLNSVGLRGLRSLFAGISGTPRDQPAKARALTLFADKCRFEWLRQQFVQPSAADHTDDQLSR